MRTGGTTRSQAWNHDRNEVLRVALYPNPVFVGSTTPTILSHKFTAHSRSD